MQRTPVKSSTLVSVGFDDGILEVEFKNGDVYRYYGVPSGTYAGLMTAPSKGSYLDRFVKKRNFRYEKIDLTRASRESATKMTDVTIGIRVTHDTNEK